MTIQNPPASVRAARGAAAEWKRRCELELGVRGELGAWLMGQVDELNPFFGFYRGYIGFI